MATAFEQFRSRLGINNPKRKGTGFNYAPFTVQQGQPTPGERLAEKIGERKQTGFDIYDDMRSQQTNRIASDVAQKSAFNVPTDEFGLPEKKLTSLSDIFSKQAKGITKRGNLAFQAEEARNQWDYLNDMQNIGSYGFSGSMSVNGSNIPGASSGNVGARAVELAKRAMKNGTPYVWGGNSLTKGVDCSALVQQVYRQLGVEVPRVTYDQAKHGRKVSLNSIKVGDLIFYRNLGHVGIYMGGGKMIHAANPKSGIIISNVYGSSNGSPQLAIRPY